MINIENTLVVLIDIQERLVNMLTNKDEIIKTTSTLLHGTNILELPAILTEQYPKGLGSTINEVKNIVNKDNSFIEKTSFSAYQTPEFKQKIKSLNKKNIIICGIETHICVYQTVCELIESGYNVIVAKDACASRTQLSYNTGLELMKDNGAHISTVETVLFELLKTSRHPKFKEVQNLIK